MNSDVGRVVGVGMPKSGTKTLGACFEILGLTPRIQLHRPAARKVVHGDPSYALTVAEGFRSFEDSPWFEIFDLMDDAFPNSKFILTTRRSPRVHATSMWFHQVKKGRAAGKPTKSFLRSAEVHVRRHEERVRGYFADRPGDLLVVCWERGDDWSELCSFLGLPVPEQPFPHKNLGLHRRSSRHRLAIKARRRLVQRSRMLRRPDSERAR